MGLGRKKKGMEDVQMDADDEGDGDRYIQLLFIFSLVAYRCSGSPRSGKFEFTAY